MCVDISDEYKCNFSWVILSLIMPLINCALTVKDIINKAKSKACLIHFFVKVIV